MFDAQDTAYHQTLPNKAHRLKMCQTDMRFSKQTNIALLVGGIVFLPVAVIAFAILADHIMPSRARLALPAGATEVHETYDQSFFLPDYSRNLTARIPETEFAPFALKMGLQRQKDGSYLAMPTPEHRLEATYRNGYLYYTEFEW